MKTSTAVALALCAVLLASIPVHNQAKTRALKIDTTEITAPSFTISPDGQALVFTALGHLFQMSTAGGAATQLTFGPFYDADPAFSPDGRRLAFTSNRDNSASNVFVLDVASKRVTQVTRDVESGRAAWSPDGQTIAYTRNVAREDHPFELIPGFGDNGLRELRTVPAAGGASSAASSGPALIESVFYLPDGRLAWTVRDGGGGGMTTGPQVKQTRIEARGANGSTTTLATVGGNIGRAAPGPKGDGVYYVTGNALQWLPFGANTTATAGPRVQDNGARFTVARDGGMAYFSERGGIMRAALPKGDPERLKVSASIAMEVRPLVEKKYEAPPASTSPAAMRAVLAPSLSPDGRKIAVTAGGLLFEQTLAGGGAAQQLFETRAFERDPAYSPDGTKLAYVASEDGRRTLRVYDYATRQTKTLFTVGGAAWPLHPSWSHDSQRIVFQHAQNLGQPFPIIVVDVADGKTQEVTQTVGSWVARPHFSTDGRSIYFTNRAGKIGTLHRISLEPNAKPEAVTEFTRHVHEGLVSPDGKWMAQRRNSEIWIAPMGATPLHDAQLRRFSAEGGRSFSFAADSAAIVYTAGGKVYRQPVAGGTRAELPVRIALPRSVAPPLLITRVRALDLTAGRFGDEASIFVQNGRIQWIGSEQGRQLPANVVRLDGGGRYAIPGLFDAHVHSAWQNQQTNEDSFIAFGVTSVRDTGSTLDVLNALDDRSNVTALPAPRYFYSGEIFEGLMPLWGDAFYQIGSEQEARAEVRNLRNWGSDFVKIYPSLPWQLQQAVSDEAHRVGLPIVGHGLSPDEIIRRVTWGSTSLEHGTPVTGVFEDVHKLLASATTAADLTLSVGGGALMRAQEPAWEKNWRVLEFVPEESRRRGQGGGRGGGAPQTREQMLAAASGRFERMVTAQRTGVRMTGGTDSLMGGVFFGLSLHWEIAQFADAGMSNIDVLRMATLGGASLVGASSDLGSLTPGKLADIVLLDESPLENIRSTQAIWQVVKGGHVYDPAKLRAASTTATAAR